MPASLLALAGWLDEMSWPPAPCPVCDVGTVGFDAATHQVDRKSQQILDLHASRQGPDDELVGTFIGTLKCGNPKCGQKLAMTGDWQLVVNEGDMALGGYGEIFRIRYVSPPFKILPVPPAAPEPVKSALDHACTLLWASPSAAANQLRQAVEEVMTDQGVATKGLNRSGKLSRLSLHQRIELFSKSSHDVAEVLEAVKWIGNGGSHDNSLTVADVLTGSQILAVALRALYDTSDADLMAKVRAINAARGIPSKSP